MLQSLRKVNFFEIVLLIVGLGVGVVGLLLINYLYQDTQVITWDLIQTIFIWLLLIIFLIVAATIEDVKEEITIIIRENIKETKLLREINKSQLEEAKRLRNDIKKE